MTKLDCALTIENVDKYYGTVRALSQINLHVKPGEFLTILGPSGSGKTTLLKCVAGFETINGGRLLLGEADITDKDPGARNIGMVFQNYALFPHMTVEQNVAFPLVMRRMGRAEIAKRVADALELTELGRFAKRYPRQLSGGQQQRVALSRAIVFEPSLLLLDEPFGALDRKLRETLQLEVRRLQRELNLTTLFITHDQEEALLMSDRIAVMFDGELHQVSGPEEIYQRPANARVANFIGESNLLKGKLSAARGSATTLRFVLESGISVALAARNDAACSVDGEKVLLLRPEHLSPCIDSGCVGNQKNVLPTTVEELVYLGNVSRYRLRMQDGTELVMRLSGSGPKLRVGDAVRVRFSEDDAVLVAAERHTLPPRVLAEVA